MLQFQASPLIHLQVGTAPQLPSVLRVEKPDQRFDRGPIAPAGHETEFPTPWDFSHTVKDLLGFANWRLTFSPNAMAS